MKKLFSARYSAGAVNGGMFILRLVFGILMIKHGYDKLTDYNGTVEYMQKLMGDGAKIWAALLIFAEFFCSLFLILGIFTRLSTIPLIIAMFVALYKQHNMDVFGHGETVVLYLGAYFTILIIGPGKASIDGMISK